MITGDSTKQHEEIQVLSLWRNRDFLLLWLGQGISLAGSQISQFAFPLLILALFGSPGLAGIGAALVGLPFFLLALPAGALVDRWNRKRLMIVCDIGRGLVLASMAVALLFGHLTLIQAFTCAFLEGCLYCLFDLANNAALTHVVATEQRTAAFARQSFLTNAAYSAGQALAGVLLSLARFLPFAVDALSYVISIVTVASTHSPFQGERSSVKTFSLSSMLHEIHEGIEWVWRRPVVRLLMLQSMLGNAFSNGLLLLFVVIATRLHVSAALTGIVFALAGLGALVGSLLVELLSARVALRTLLIASQYVISGLILAYLLAHSLIILGIVTAALATVAPLAGVLSFSYRISLVPDALRGRVLSVMRLLAYAGPSLGLATIGLLLQSFDIVPTVLVCTVASLLMAVLLMVSPSLRQAQHELDSGEKAAS